MLKLKGKGFVGTIFGGPVLFFLAFELWALPLRRWTDLNTNIHIGLLSVPHSHWQ